MNEYKEDRYMQDEEMPPIEEILDADEDSEFILAQKKMLARIQKANKKQNKKKKESPKKKSDKESKTKDRKLKKDDLSLDSNVKSTCGLSRSTDLDNSSYLNNLNASQNSSKTAMGKDFKNSNEDIECVFLDSSSSRGSDLNENSVFDELEKNLTSSKSFAVEKSTFKANKTSIDSLIDENQSKTGTKTTDCKLNKLIKTEENIRTSDLRLDEETVDDKKSNEEEKKFKKDDNNLKEDDKSKDDYTVLKPIKRTKRTNENKIIESTIETPFSKRRKCTLANNPLRFVKPVKLNTPTSGLKIGLSRRKSSSNGFNPVMNCSTPISPSNNSSNSPLNNSINVSKIGIKIGLSRRVKTCLHPEVYKKA